MADMLDDILQRLQGMDPESIAKLRVGAANHMASSRYLPNPGPQTLAYLSEADVMLYGGAAGGGKSNLIIGLALSAHKRSLLMRRAGVDHMGGGGLIEETLKVYGTRKGYSGASPPTLRTHDGRIITFGSANLPGDEQAYQGRARDLLGLDEAVQFMSTQVTFLMGWVRSEDPGQRTRTVMASNPPVSSQGDWIIGMFRPWLDLTHPNPAEPGELRWYITAPDGSDVEVDDSTPVEINGRAYRPMSRTFIPAMLDDNPYLKDTSYRATLDALPEPLRSAMRDGNFMLARQDEDNQLIPTQWVLEAQARWKPEPPTEVPMTSMALDVAQGGLDNTVIATIYGAWFDRLKVVPGTETPDGKSVAGLVVMHRKNGAKVTVDAGGGYGGATIERLEDNSIKVEAYKGAEGTTRRTIDNLLGFTNVRTEAYWRLREGLDPEQDGGSLISLPPDPVLTSDLTAVTFDASSGIIKALPKDKVVAKLGRSPDRGDAVVMAWYNAPKVETHGKKWRGYNEEHARRKAGVVRVIQSRPAARKIKRS